MQFCGNASFLPPPLGLSKWIRQQVQHHENFGSALESLHAFAERNQKGIDFSSQCSNEVFHVPLNSKEPSSASQQEATIHLSPDVPVKSEEQSFVPETHLTTTINSINPGPSNQPGNITAIMQESMFISCGGKKGFINNFKCSVTSLLEETNIFL